jgi:hypothetical protein
VLSSFRVFVIVFQASSRKTANFRTKELLFSNGLRIKSNHNVSLLIDTRDEDKGPRRSKARALTVSGIFREIEEKESRDRIRAKLVERHPHIREFAHHPDAQVFSIKATSFLLLGGLTNAYFEFVT